MMTQEKTIVVYACGGAGINIGRSIEDNTLMKVSANETTKFSKIVVNYIDTSEANTKFRSVDKNVYLFDGIDGSGSDRSKNKDSISDSIKDILIKHPPGNLNIVINSTAGGSGSVIGPLLISQLLADSELVIAMAAQTTSTLKQLRNTVSVLSSYENIALRRKKVLPLFLCNNTVESESNVNKNICSTVEILSILFSGQLERLDSADLDHWINFNKVTSNPVGVVQLDLSNDASSIAKDHTVCSVATLTNGPEVNSDFPVMVEYQTIGFIKNSESEEGRKALHLALIDGPIQEEYEKRNKELAEAERMFSSRKTRKNISSDCDDDGINYD